MGSGADIVSIGELLKATKAGISSKKIVFSGVGKTADEIKLAIKKNVLLINMESENEAILINKISGKRSKITSVGIRLNPDVTGKTNKKISTGSKEDKFGLSFNDCIDLCKKVSSMKNLKLEGLSVHIGSQITNINPFRKVLSVLNKIIDKTKVNFKFIDLGGGMGISYANNNKKLNYKKYNLAIKKFLKNHKSKIIFEPGRYITANAGILLTKVIRNKESYNNNFLIVDAAMNDILRPALYDATHNILPLIKIEY